MGRGYPPPPVSYHWIFVFKYWLFVIFFIVSVCMYSVDVYICRLHLGFEFAIEDTNDTLIPALRGRRNCSGHTLSGGAFSLYLLCWYYKYLCLVGAINVLDWEVYHLEKLHSLLALAFFIKVVKLRGQNIWFLIKVIASLSPMCLVDYFVRWSATYFWNLSNYSHGRFS